MAKVHVRGLKRDKLDFIACILTSYKRRCYKLSLHCAYIVNYSPTDEEFIELAKQGKLLEEVESLKDELAHMEATMSNLRDPNIGNSPAQTLPSLIEDSDRSVSSTDDGCISPLTETDISYSKHPNKRTKRLISFGGDSYVDVSKCNEAKGRPSWTLTVKNGGFCIDTHVNTYSDLYNNLYRVLQVVNSGSRLPPVVTNCVREDTLVGALNEMFRKKYGKVHCKNVARSIQIFITPSIPDVDTMVVVRSPENIKLTTSKLIQAYLRCQHLQQLAIHVPTFFRLFIDAGSSSAVMAFCATVCTLRCKHIVSCLPSVSLVEYGKFYFERARDALSDMFDQCNLETFTTYVFLAVYTSAVGQIEDSKLYTEMAERVATILKPSYSTAYNTKSKSLIHLQKKSEAIHFKRLLNYLHRVETFVEISEAQIAALNSGETRLPFCTLVHSNEGEWQAADDDSVQEKWFIKMHSYILLLQRAVHKASRCAYSSDIYHLVGLIGHQVEMAIFHWYTKVLPREFRLSLPLFDSNVGCEKFYATLERECAHSAVPALTTLAAYEEWVVFCQSYLPKRLPQPENEWKLLKTCWDGGEVKDESRVNKKWIKRIEKLLELRRRINFEGSDQEYLATIEAVIGSSEYHVQKRIVMLGIHASFNTVRLARYLRSRSGDCYFDMRILINAWQLLLTISKVQIMMPPEIIELIPRVHKYLRMCLAIVYDEVKLQPYQGQVSDYVRMMEEEFRSQTVKDDDCDCVSCPYA
ncbi:hypothetical protein G6F70_005363 [Rhizopus microsporus]|uniref:Uncharacterized protein n=1 Tax=Rhizopus microsporus TaxID=58291 RepID=A0A1X0RQ40_RHIZD|nr:hypothetical protein G6F71_005129 [Rhizopus microsporus]KAG1198953.1 hypothetical protein G6F70_005363 [Rhizopus microsporus]KAG1210725.1 hypothetical protein G6F69_005233 [Rhizopus microsporus]KAG1232737.1 hypothetical protein G6F67_004800 [Rhizopus microsporus]KAG1264595.1 hypothetical protein G6F68_004216 [Rhizopus microsporus]